MPSLDDVLDGAFEDLGIDINPPAKPIPHAIDWIENNFYLYDTGQKMSLFPPQKWALFLAMARDEKGAFRYDTILWSWPKKSAKSSVIAAVADYVAEHKTRASVKLIANDLKQADSRVGMYLRENIKIAQKQGQRPGIISNPSGYTIKYPNRSLVECIPIDPKGEAGGNDDMLVYSELWGWKSKAHQKMWSEMTLSPTKWGNSQRWIDTYAGVEGESPILEQLYETGVKNGVRVPDCPYEFYTNEAAKMLTVWVTVPLFPWQTPEYYLQEQGQLLPEEFSRMHGNKWASATEAFIPLQWWTACENKNLEPLGRRGVVMGLDAASKDDCFACVIVSKGDNGKVQVRHCRVWYPPEGGRIDFRLVREEIAKLCIDFSVEEVAYDETQLVSMSQDLGDNTFWRAFPQGHDRLVADKRLYDMIRDRQIEHSGEPQLAEHILNADRKPETNNTLRIVKRTPQKKIDAVIALSMANDRIMYLNL